jgi:hypothetical protein
MHNLTVMVDGTIRSEAGWDFGTMMASMNVLPSPTMGDAYEEDGREEERQRLDKVDVEHGYSTIKTFEGVSGNAHRTSRITFLTTSSSPPPPTDCPLQMPIEIPRIVQGNRDTSRESLPELLTPPHSSSPFAVLSGAPDSEGGQSERG